MPDSTAPQEPTLRFAKGRGAGSNRDSRFLAWTRVADPQPDSGTHPEQATAAPPAGPRTVVRDVAARSVISRNQSPDIPFDRSLNPYQGCEHGCIYCYARPTHAYHDLSPGLDFETRILAKANAASVLRRELGRPAYRAAPLALGANTDPYQPAERTRCLTRAVLEVLRDCHHPVMVTTKSALVERDIDILSAMAAQDLARVYVSVGSLDHRLARTLEPRATAPARRIETIRRLSATGIPTGVIVAPVIPSLNDAGLEAVLEAAAAAGASQSAYVLLRLPREVRELFVEWLSRHFPGRAAHVMSLLRQMRDGLENDAQFGTRMRGEGPFAQLYAQRFRLASRRCGLDRPVAPLDVTQFRAPVPAAPSRASGGPSSGQLNLF